VSGTGNRHLRLTHAYGFDNDAFKAGGVEQRYYIATGFAQATQAAPCRHAADKDAAVATQGAHPHAVAQERTAGKGAGRVDGDNGNGYAGAAISLHQSGDQRRFARPRRTGDANDVGLAAVGVERAQKQVGVGLFILNTTDRACQRQAIAGAHAFDQGFDGCRHA
jgi:hypothetical protein